MQIVVVASSSSSYSPLLSCAKKYFIYTFFSADQTFLNPSSSIKSLLARTVYVWNQILKTLTMQKCYIRQ